MRWPQDTHFHHLSYLLNIPGKFPPDRISNRILKGPDLHSFFPTISSSSLKMNPSGWLLLLKRVDISLSFMFFRRQLTNTNCHFVLPIIHWPFCLIHQQKQQQQEPGILRGHKVIDYILSTRRYLTHFNKEEWCLR